MSVLCAMVKRTGIKPVPTNHIKFEPNHINFESNRKKPLGTDFMSVLCAMVKDYGGF